MLIDFHTHIFPAQIANHAIDTLIKSVKRVCGMEITAHTDATYEGLLKSMEENGVSKSVIMPVVTNPDKADSVNEYAASLRNNRIISFAGVHPLQKNASDAVKRISEQGFKGIKMHPEFQQVYINAPESLAVLKTAEEEGLLVMLHTGADIGVAPPVHCKPQRLAHTLEYVSGANIIAAHMGGWNMWEDVLRYLVKTPVFMDTAFISGFIDDDLCREIIRAHGADKILFGSDSPWENPRHTLKYLMSLGLSDEETEKITHKNSEKLLTDAVKYSV